MYILNKKKLIFSYVLNAILFVITMPFNSFRKNRKPNVENPKILVSRPDHIGDVLLCTPIFHSLKEKFPLSKIVLICGSWSGDIVKNNPYIDEFWTIDCPWWTSIRKDALKKKTSFYRLYTSLLQKIKSERFDIFLELRGDIRHIFLFGWIPNIPMRISNNRSGGKFLVTHSIPYQFDVHEIEKNYNLLKPLEPFPKFYKTEVYTTEENKKVFDKIPIRDKYVILFNGGRSDLRKMESKKLLTLIKALKSEYDLQSIMVGGKEDVEEAIKIEETIKDANDFLNLCGKISLLEVKELIDKAVLFIGNDSSVSHIVASTSTPAISLYGPMLPDQVKPLGNEKRIIYHKYHCSPCVQTKCIITNSFTHAKCMEDITIEEIFIAIKSLLVDNN
jgi:ADP-heptose:LPS heptosyltransferase